MSSGSRNLLVLGISAILIAILTSGISLALYHDSGDIYLDRSRPGYLPEKSTTEPEEEPYSFPSTGALSAEELEEYTKNLKSAIDSLESLKNPFSEDVLSDEALGIPSK